MTAPTFSNLGASAAPDFTAYNDATSYANASWTPPTSELIFVYVLNVVGSGTPNQPTMSGNSLTWTAIKSVTSSLYRLTLFGANASGSAAGATTVDMAGQTQISMAAAFGKATDADLSGTVAAAFVQSPTNFGTATSGSITLAAVGHADNRPISGWALVANLSMTARTSWTELDEVLEVQQNIRTETQYRSDDFETTASVTWGGSSQLYFGIAAEIKGAVAAATKPGVIYVSNQAVQRASRW